MRPGRWNASPLTCHPKARSFWRKAHVFPLWESGDPVIMLPKMIESTGGTFPTQQGSWMTFDVASTEYINVDPTAGITQNVAGGLAPFSVGAVFRATDAGVGNFVLYGEGRSTTNTPVYVATIDGSQGGVARTNLRNDSSDSLFQEAVGETILDDKEWHAVVWAHDPTNKVYRIHVDGNNESLTIINNDTLGSVRTIDRVTIGASQRTTISSHFDGQIALIVTWLRLLPEGEARAWSLDPFAMIRHGRHIPVYPHYSAKRV